MLKYASLKKLQARNLEIHNSAPKTWIAVLLTTSVRASQAEKCDMSIYSLCEIVAMFMRVLQKSNSQICDVSRAMCNKSILSALDILLGAVYRIEISFYCRVTEW